MDNEFPPMIASIYDPSENFPFNEEIIWTRANEFLEPSKRGGIQIFPDTLKPSQLVEGKLGDGWFASALACLAEKPALL